MSLGSAPRAALLHHAGMRSSSDHSFPRRPFDSRCCSISQGEPTAGVPWSIP